MDDAEYKSKLERAGELAALDPDPNSSEGLLLLSLVMELQDYERVHFPLEFTKADIAMMRGGLPEKCSFCDSECDWTDLEPEEAGDWACHKCLLRWAKEDGNVREAVFYERLVKEEECRRTR